MCIFKFPRKFRANGITGESPWLWVLASPPISSSIGGFAVIAHWVLNVHFPRDSRVPFSTLTGQLEMCFGDVLVQVSSPFCFWIYSLWNLCSLCISATRTLSGMCVANAFCHYFSCLFIILLVFLGEQKYLMFMGPKHQVFLDGYCILNPVQNLSPSEDHEDVLLSCLLKALLRVLGFTLGAPSAWN